MVSRYQVQDEIKYSLEERACYLQIINVPSIEELESLIDKYHHRFQQLEASNLSKLNAFYKILRECSQNKPEKEEIGMLN
jgi:hypothetical protein